MTTNRFWQLDAHPQGDDFASALSLREEPLQPLADGEVRVAAQWLSMDAGTRMWMSPRTDGYQPPLPLGSKMSGLTMGRVVETRDPAFPEGTLVRGFGQWADYTVVTPAAAGLMALDETLADPREHFGALGMNGWTALLGVRDTARIQPGQWIAVSAAAGATGSLAVQVARILGARVVAIAGGPAKCAYLTGELGADIAIDYKADDIEARLAAEVPGGLDAYFDNVGGPMLDAILPNMALMGCVAVCGLVAVYDADKPLPGPARYDQVLMKRLRIEGFFLPDHFHRTEEFLNPLRQWYDEGRIVSRFDETPGLENTLAAYAKMLGGGAVGKVLVKVA